MLEALFVNIWVHRLKKNICNKLYISDLFAIFTKTLIHKRYG